MNADVHALAGAFALDALPPEEEAEFRAHLAQCSACQTEVAELQVTATHLGIAVAEQPPARVRDGVVRAARQTRQLPPATRPADIGPRRIRRTWLAAAAAAIVVGAGAAGLTAVLDDPAEPESDPIAAVLTAPDADAAAARLRGGGRMTVISSDRLDEAVVLSEQLPPPGRDRIYQLWLVDPDGDARSADVLIDAAGAVDIVRDVRPGDQVAITREPAGGSTQPSMTPLAITRPL